MLQFEREEAATPAMVVGGGRGAFSSASAHLFCFGVVLFVLVYRLKQGFCGYFCCAWLIAVLAEGARETCWRRAWAKCGLTVCSDDDQSVRAESCEWLRSQA